MRDGLREPWSIIELPGLRWRLVEPEPLADPAIAPFTSGHDLFGDVTYDAGLLEAGHVPGVGERKRLTETTSMINRLRERKPGPTILAAHDPGAAAALAVARRAPAPA